MNPSDHHPLHHHSHFLSQHHPLSAPQFILDNLQQQQASRSIHPSATPQNSYHCSNMSSSTANPNFVAQAPPLFFPPNHLAPSSSSSSSSSASSSSATTFTHHYLTLPTSHHTNHKLKPPDPTHPTNISLEAMLASKQLLNSGGAAAPLQVIGGARQEYGGSEGGIGGGGGRGGGSEDGNERESAKKRQAMMENGRYRGSGGGKIGLSMGGGGMVLYEEEEMGMEMEAGEGGEYGGGMMMMMMEGGTGDMAAEMGGWIKGGAAAAGGRRLGYEQVKALEKEFEAENRLEPERKVKLATTLGLQPRQVAVWFQNRRARWKTKQMERDFSLLKSKLDALKADRDQLLHERDKLKAELARLKGDIVEDKEGGDQDSPTLASCSLVDDASHQVNISDQGHVGKTIVDEKPENDSLSSTEDSANINGDIEDSTSMLQRQTALKNVNNEEADFYNHHLRMGTSSSHIFYKNNVKNEEWGNGEQGQLNMSMEWYNNW